MQIIQPSRVNDALLRAYTKTYHAYDRPTWEAIIRETPVRAIDCWQAAELETSPYVNGLLRPLDRQYVLAAPLRSPLIDGYPGAIQILRAPEHGAFNANDIDAIRKSAADIDAAIDRDRAARRAEGGGDSRSESMNHRAAMRVFVFEPSLNVRVGARSFEALDPVLRNNMRDLARQRFAQTNGAEMTTDRTALADARGDLWSFRVVTHQSFPALGDTPFVFFCIQPDCRDWGLLRASDFAAEPELARLVPALSFMQQQYSRGPTLQEIARTVHLSPFHFHRRFTELLGITPKHFLLDCQIEAAKEKLLARQSELSEIAKACGFAHQSHFTSRFKQATGLTPTRWRRFAMESRSAR